MSGSDTPRRSTRSRMIVTERLRSSFVRLRPFGGTACFVISSPPWRSRPSVGFLCTGDEGMTISATPTRPATTRATTMMAERRVIDAAGRLAALGRCRLLSGTRIYSFPFVRNLLYAGRGRRGVPALGSRFLVAVVFVQVLVLVFIVIVLLG